jgi:hypothetical protein
MVIDHILSRQGWEPLNSHYYATTYPAVYAAATRLFGSWKNAIEDCGLNYAEIRKYRKWSRTKILDEVKRLHKGKEPLNSIYIQKNHKPLYMAAMKRFKNWGNAVRAAGINYENILLRKQMSKAEIKSEILKLYHENVDMAYPNMRENHLDLLAAAMKKLGNGSWVLARKKCGIKINYRLSEHKKKYNGYRTEAKSFVV